ncbi:MAG: hypothetical protein PHC53_01365 [Patescibacteria group bacterium]|nr:hypothetical protein [Patescibacteria group bacterium]
MNVGGLWEGVKGQGQDTDWTVIQAPSVLASNANLPLELKYVLSLRPSRQALVNQMLERGCGLGISKQTRVPERTSQAVERIANLTHEGLTYCWLENLVRLNQEPVWNQAEQDAASAQGINLKEEIDLLKDLRETHCRFALLKFPGIQTTQQDEACIKEMNQDLSAVSAARLLNLLRGQVSAWKLPWFLPLLLAALIVGPLAQWAESLLSGSGLLIAILMPSVYLIALDWYKAYAKAKAPWLMRRLVIWDLVALAGAVLCFIVGYLFVQGSHWYLAGMALGVSAMLIPMYYVLRHIKRSWVGLQRLMAIGKISPSLEQAIWPQSLLEQERGSVARVTGLLISIIIMGWLFGTYPSIDGKIWLLAILAGLPLVIAELNAHFELWLDKWFYTRKLKKLWQQAIILTSDAW